MPSTDPHEPQAATPARRRSPVPIAVVTLAVLLIALLAYGLTTSGASTNLDTAVKQGQRPAAPAAQVALPRSAPPAPSGSRICRARWPS